MCSSDKELYELKLSSSSFEIRSSYLEHEPGRNCRTKNVGCECVRKNTHSCSPSLTRAIRCSASISTNGGRDEGIPTPEVRRREGREAVLRVACVSGVGYLKGGKSGSRHQQNVQWVPDGNAAAPEGTRAYPLRSSRSWYFLPMIFASDDISMRRI